MARCLIIAFLLAGMAQAQPLAFIDGLPGEPRETVGAFYAYVVDGTMWSNPEAPEEMWNRIRLLFEPLNPRDGEWGVFDAAIARDSHVAHDFFDTLETCLTIGVAVKGGSAQETPLVDFEKPRGARAGGTFILRRGERSAELPLPRILLLQLILRKTRGMHSVLT